MTEIIQGSQEWHSIRLGKVTASRVADVVAKTKSGPAASRGNYLSDLFLERVTGAAVEGFKSSAMQWGIDNEPDARAAYQFEKNMRVAQVGFVPHNSIAMAGASPDGLVGDNGLVEIKCPFPATHLETLKTGKIPANYITQMMWQMACTGRQWCDFISYDPRFPEWGRLFIQRVPRDDARITELETEVVMFLKELSDTVQELTRKYGGAPVEDGEITDQVKLMMAG